MNETPDSPHPTTDGAEQNASKSAGQRLDQFISGAKRLGTATSQRAKQMADVAAPKLKKMGGIAQTKATELGAKTAPAMKWAREAASHAFEVGAANNSFVARIRAFYLGGGNARKALVLYGGGMAGLLLLSLLAMPFIFMLGGGHKSKVGSFWDKHAGTWDIEGNENSTHWTFRAGESGISELTCVATVPAGPNQGKQIKADIPSEGGSGAGIKAEADHATVDFGTTSKGPGGVMQLDFNGTTVTGKYIASPGHESPVTGTVQRPAVASSTPGYSSANVAAGPVASEKQAMLALGDKYGPADSVLAQRAIEEHQQGLPWSVADEIMTQASPEMQRAYRQWRLMAASSDAGKISGRNGSDNGQPKTFWTEHAGIWDVQLPQKSVTSIFRFIVKDGTITGFDEGVSINGKEQWWHGAGQIGSPEITAQTLDDATVRVRLMEKVHELHIHVSGNQLSGWNGDGEKLFGNVE